MLNRHKRCICFIYDLICIPPNKAIITCRCGCPLVGVVNIYCGEITQITHRLREALKKICFLGIIPK